MELERNLKTALKENDELRAKLIKAQNKTIELASELLQLKQTVSDKQTEIEKLRLEIARFEQTTAAQQIVIKELETKEANDQKTWLTRLERQPTARKKGNDKLEKDIVGEQNEIDQLKRCMEKSVQLIYSFNDGKAEIDAVTTLGKELFVKYGGQPDIAVYHKETFSLLRHLSVEDVTSVTDMSSCVRYQCIYIADQVSEVIHRVDKASSKQTKWSVGGQPEGLSVNCENNVIVTLFEVHKVKVFTTHGELTKEIDLQPACYEYSAHTIQLLTTDRLYVVSQYSSGSHASLNRVVLVDDSGRIHQSSDRETGSNDDQFNKPSRLAAVTNRFVVVADTHNKRLVMLSNTLRYVMSWKVGGEPCRIWFDEEIERLFVCVTNFTRGHVEVYRVSQ